MIGKLIKGSGAKGLFAYLLGTHDMNGDKRPRVDLIGGSFAGSNATELSAEFGQLRALKPRLSRAVAHQCLRLPEGDTIPDDHTWSKIADRWAGEMGFESYAVVSHGDHIHIAASRINPNGTIVSDSHDWRRSEAIIRKIEIEFGLTQIESSHLLEPEKAVDHHRAPTRGQIAMVERGETPPSAILAELINDKIKGGCTASDLVLHLENNGVAVHPNIASTGKISGMSYELYGMQITSKAMGRGFTWSNLQKRGMTYVEDQDLQRIREVGHRTASSKNAGTSAGNSEHNPTNQNLKSIVAEPTRSDSETHIASSPSPRLNGSDNEQNSQSTAIGIERNRRSERTSRTDNRDIGALGTQAQRRSSGDPAKTTIREQSETKHTNKNISNINNISSDIQSSSDLERIIILAVAAASKDRSESARSTTKDRPGNKGLANLKLHASEIIDRTKGAVLEYLNALPAETYRLQLVRPNMSNVNITGQSAEQVLKSVSWLKAQNAQGSDIYIRPEDRRYILIDDITPSNIRKMTNDGFEPALVMETSTANFAAWIKVTNETEPTAKEATAIAKSLAKAYEGDPAAADYAHVSRLAGFTNRKPNRQVNGKSPFVVIKEASGRIAKAGTQLINQIRLYLENKSRTEAISQSEAITPTATKDGNPAAAYQSAMQKYISDNNTDLSQADFRASQDMALKGWSKDQISSAIQEASPSVLDRKGQAAPEYATRTATNAILSDKVQSELQRRAKEKEANEQHLKWQEEKDARDASRRAPRPRF